MQQRKDAGMAQRTMLKINDKTAATNSVTFSSIDPKRADGKMWSLTYEPFDSDGNVVTKTEETNVDWT